MQTFWADIRYGVRLLLKNPGFSVIAVLTLALGIGANTAIFSIVYGVLLRPLPYPEPQRLVRVFDVQPSYGLAPSDYPEYLGWKTQSQVFEESAAYFNTPAILTGSGTPEEILTLRATSSLATLFGFETQLGRTLRPEEDSRSSARAVVLDYGFWQSHFGGDPAILGKSINLSGEPCTVVGVLRRGRRLPENRAMLMGLRLDEKTAPRGMHFLTVVGRLRPGVSLVQARQDAAAAATHLQKERATTHGMQLEGLREDTVNGADTPLLVMLGAVGFVLLVACANVANLLLARAKRRRKEFAIRVALGAGRWRLARQLLTESLLLGLGGGLLGLLLANWSLAGILALQAGRLPRADEVQIDGTVLAFTLLISLATSMLFGLAPVSRIWKTAPQDDLKDAGRGAVAGASRQRSLLVLSEVALSLVLLIGAGLLLRSFTRLLSADKGFDAARVLTFDLNLSGQKYSQPTQEAAFFARVLERLGALPGVEAAAASSSLALGGNGSNGDIAIEGRQFPRETRAMADKRIVSSQFFRAMHIPVIHGRPFSPGDIAGAPPVAIINQALARKFFPNENPIGKRIDFMWDTEGWQEIVGVVGDVKEEALNVPPAPAIYVPFLQRPASAMTVFLRAKSDDPAALTAAARTVVLGMDSQQPLSNVRTLEDVVSLSVADRRLTLGLMSAFALLALVLSGIGVYGVVSYSVAQRTNEIGVRLALGAQPRDILHLVVGGGLRSVLAGVGIGLAASLGLTRLMASLLYNVSPADPLTYAAVSVLLIGIALAACFVPARRATRVDPMVALRYE
jgi:predicted permease